MRCPDGHLLAWDGAVVVANWRESGWRCLRCQGRHRWFADHCRRFPTHRRRGLLVRGALGWPALACSRRKRRWPRALPDAASRRWVGSRRAFQHVGGILTSMSARWDGVAWSAMGDGIGPTAALTTWKDCVVAANASRFGSSWQHPRPVATRAMADAQRACRPEHPCAPAWTAWARSTLAEDSRRSDMWRLGAGRGSISPGYLAAAP